MTVIEQWKAKGTPVEECVWEVSVPFFALGEVPEKLLLRGFEKLLRGFEKLGF